MRGLSEENGSWKTIRISLRYGFSARSFEGGQVDEPCRPRDGS